jgi:hypothetical protein
LLSGTAHCVAKYTLNRSPLLDQSPTSGLKHLRADLHDELPGCGDYISDRAAFVKYLSTP